MARLAMLTHVCAFAWFVASLRSNAAYRGKLLPKHMQIVDALEPPTLAHIENVGVVGSRD
jgi:hypothetical protein